MPHYARVSDGGYLGERGSPPINSVEVPAPPMTNGRFVGGTRWLNGEWVQVSRDVLPTPAAPLRRPITKGQMLQQAVIDGWFDEDEALDWSMGVAFPTTIEDYITTLPVERQKNTRLRLFSMNQVEPNHSDLTLIAQLYLPEASPVEIEAALDSFFLSAVNL
jgi:hypothetical protein